MERLRAVGLKTIKYEHFYLFNSVHRTHDQRFNFKLDNLSGIDMEGIVVSGRAFNSSIYDSVNLDKCVFITNTWMGVGKEVLSYDELIKEWQSRQFDKRMSQLLGEESDE